MHCQLPAAPANGKTVDENAVVFAGDDKYKMALRIKNYVENLRID